MRYFLHKSRDLVGRGGFEPKSAPLNPFKIKGFNVYSPIFRQIKTFKCCLKKTTELSL